MSVHKEFDCHFLECDICQNIAEDENGAIYFDSFWDAQYFAIDNKWKRKYEGGGWIDICPECQE